MARISSFTIFVWVTLVLYTAGAGIFSVYAAGGDINTMTTPTNILPFMTGTYAFMGNGTLVKGGATITMTGFTPTKNAKWLDNWYYGYGIQVTYNGYLYTFIPWKFTQDWYFMNGTKASYNSAQGYPVLNVTYIINEYDPLLNYSKFQLDPYVNSFYSDVYFSPKAPYTNMVDSIGNNTVDILIGSNSTSFSSFDIGVLYNAVFNVVTGFYSLGAPLPVTILLGGMWWILIILGVAKLILG